MINTFLLVLDNNSFASIKPETPAPMIISNFKFLVTIRLLNLNSIFLSLFSTFLFSTIFLIRNISNKTTKAL